MEDAVDDKTLDQKLTDTLRETLSDLNERGEGVPEETKAEPNAAPEASAAVEEPVRADKARDPATGKFVKTEESAAPAKANTLDSPTAAVAPAQAAEVPTEESPLVGPSGQAIDLNRAPSSWKPAAKAAWMNLPPEVRAEVYRREGDFHVGNKPLKDNADFGQRIRTMTEPYRGMVEAEGGTLERSIENYFKTAATLRQGTPEQKLQMLFSIDQQFGGTLNQHFQRSVQAAVAQATGQPMQQQVQQQVYQDPRVDTLMQRIEREDRERQGREQVATSQATERFLAAKDDKGQPLYPFVDNVIEDMSDRVKMLRRANPEFSHEEILKKAYEQAVWANPETRDVLLKQQQAAAAAPVETLRKVEKAKAVVAGTMPKRGALPVTAPKGKFGSPEGDEAMLDTLRQLTG